MDFEDFKEEAANYLENAGIPYEEGLDNQLWELWKRGVKSYQVVAALQDTQ